MPKMLITGIGGFVGSNSSNYFKDSYEIFGIDKNSQNRCNILKGLVNLDNLKAFGEKFDVILHFAGSATVFEAENNPLIEKEKTVNSTIDLLEYMRLYNNKAKLIYASSAAVYGNNHSDVIKETDNTDPISAYGKNKLEAEKKCFEYYEKYGLHINVIRFFSIYGEGLKKQVLWDFSNRLYEAKSLVIECFGTGDELRDFIHVWDAVRFVECVIESGSKGVVYNCACGCGCKIKEILLELAMNYVENPKLIFDNKIRVGNPFSLVANIDKAKNIGFTPKISVKEGLKRYASWYKKEHQSLFS